MDDNGNSMNHYIRIVSNWRITYIKVDKPANFNTIYVGLRKSPHTIDGFVMQVVLDTYFSNGSRYHSIIEHIYNQLTWYKEKVVYMEYAHTLAVI